MIDLKGKVAVIFGLANKRSIAYGIAQKFAEAGATLVLSYQSERLRKESEQLIEDLGQTGTAKAYQCDVANDAEIDALFAQIKDTFGTIHSVVHAVAFAPPAAIHNDFLLTTRDDFRIAHDISAYSLAALANSAQPLMAEGGSIIALTYLGSTRVIPNYNVMGVAKAALEASVRYLAADLGPQGIRVNAISAGPIKTLAASGIAGFGSKMRHHRDRAPLRKDTDTGEVADAALFMLSPLSRGITGQVLYVDGGYSIMGD